MTDEERAESRRILAVLEAAIAEFGPGELRRVAGPIRVGEEDRGSREGVCNVFDDTYEHEVWNRGTGTRFIMLVDTWHPELMPVEQKVLARVLWAPREVESRLRHGKQVLQGKGWWEEAKAEK